jgi:hypothetical protein
MGIGGRVGIATLRLLNYIYLSFINFKQTWYVICSSRKLSFGWCWLCSCTEENSAFRGEDLEAVTCKPIRNTLRFARLRWEGETHWPVIKFGRSPTPIFRPSLEHSRSGARTLYPLSHPTDITHLPHK